jgi:DNA-binding NarL/FixJ family response regulator
MSTLEREAGATLLGVLHGGRSSVARILVVDADPLARRVVRDVLEREEDLEVVAEAVEGRRAIDLAVELRPDLVMLELQLPDIDGLEVLRQLGARAPESRVAVFSVLRGDDVALRALQSGAAGVLTKELPVDSLARALRAVLDGEAAISRSLTLRLIQRLRVAPEGGRGLRPVRSRLTTREWEVLDLIARGHSTRVVAELLVLSEETVYSHVKNIMRKLGVHSRAEAVAIARQAREP